MIVGKWRATRKWGHSLGSQLVKFEHIELLNCIASCIDTPSLELEPGSVWIQHLSIGQTLMVTPCFSSLVHIRYIRLSGTFFTTSQPLCMNKTSSYHAIPVHSFLHQNPHSLYSKPPQTTRKQVHKFQTPRLLLLKSCVSPLKGPIKKPLASTNAHSNKWRLRNAVINASPLNIVVAGPTTLTLNSTRCGYKHWYVFYICN